MPLPSSSTTSLRDRTSEFLNAAERHQKQLAASTSGNVSSLASGTSSLSHKHGLANSKAGPGGFGQTPLGMGGNGEPKSNPHQNSEFAKKASELGHGIHRTSLKLQKLAQLAKRTSMFDDPTTEVEELTGIIKQDIQVLNMGIADLQRISSRSNESNKQSESHSHTVVDNLRSRLKDATSEFKDVLTSRTENLKHHKERRQMFSSNTDSDATVPLLHRRQANSTLSQEITGQSSIHQQPAPSFLQTAQQQQQLVLQQPQDTYLSSRAEALRNVENTIVELGTIFGKLSEMVVAQGELAIRIDENMDETLTNVNSAQNQLLKYLNNISSNRWLILKVFGVLLLFLVLFVMFIV